MKYPRYGKFRFNDYLLQWTLILSMFLMAMVGIILKQGFFYILVETILGFFCFFSILIPNAESFMISNNTIKIKKIGKTTELTIPQEPILIISYADIWDMTAKHLDGAQSYSLKGKYAVSIIEKMPLEKAIELLHPKYLQKYSNSTVESIFCKRGFVYSFVYDQALFEELTKNRNFQLIVPESLRDKVRVSSNCVNLYIDEGY